MIRLDVKRADAAAVAGRAGPGAEGARGAPVWLEAWSSRTGFGGTAGSWVDFVSAAVGTCAVVGVGIGACISFVVFVGNNRKIGRCGDCRF